MMSNRKKSVLSILAVTMVFVVCGMVVGFLLGRSVVLSRIKSRLREHAEMIVAKGVASSAESRSILAELEQSHFQQCSPAEIRYFRVITMQSEYLKDVARLQDGHVICSASDGVLSEPYTLPNANSHQKDGTDVYMNLTPFRNGSLSVVSLGQGRSLVVFSPYLLNYIEPSPIHFTMTVVDEPTKKSGYLLGDRPDTNRMVVDRNTESQAADTLYATRCSDRYFNCVTAFITIRAGMGMESRGLLRWSFGGGLIGAIFGLICSALYQQNRGMTRQLRRAIRGDSLRLVYQPMVDLASGRIVGAEALARWTDEYGLVVPPDVFIPLAHEVGIIGEITELVIRKSLQEMGPILRMCPEFRLSINATAVDLSDEEVLSLLASTLSSAGLSPSSLAIELTERSTADPIEVQQSIKSLRALGHEIYIDDFGTGYSSLAYLKDLAVDAIKIDKAFVQAIGTEAVTLVILPQLLAMATALKLNVIVEGVETPQQADYFAGNSARIYAQGWLYGRPTSSEDFLTLFEEDRRQRADLETVLSC